MSLPINWQPPKPLPPFDSSCGARWDTSAYIGLETSGHILLEDGSGGLLTEVAVVSVSETPITWTPPVEWLSPDWWADIRVTRARVSLSPRLVNPIAEDDRAPHTPIVYQQRHLVPVAWSPPIPYPDSP